ncbi:MAG: hypothetical protein NTX09_04650, partial [Verrucomicrobia bacterium]|nr:hypothetical protein [Verrucomicrobiota bacterium]
MMPPAATTAGIGRRSFPGISLCTHRRSIPPISAAGGRHPTAAATATAGITNLRSTEAVGFSGATRTPTVRRTATRAAWPTGPTTPTPTIIIPIETGTTVRAKARSAARIALGFGSTATAKTTATARAASGADDRTGRTRATAAAQRGDRAKYAVGATLTAPRRRAPISAGPDGH